jgi:two-component system, NarL family, sensor kinase
MMKTHLPYPYAWLTQKGLLLLLMVVVCGSSLFGQKQDSFAVKRMLKAAIPVRFTAPDKALLILDSAYQLSETIQYPLGLVTAQTHMGQVLFGSNLDKAIACNQKALSIYEQSNLQAEQLKAEILLALAEAYDEKGKKDSSAYYFYLLSETAQTSASLMPTFEIDLYTKLTVFWIRMDYDSAFLKQILFQYVEKASQAAARIPDTVNVKDNLLFLEGLYHHGLKQYDEARGYYQEFLNKKGKNMSLPRKLSVYSNIAETYLMQEKPKQALVFVNKATELAQSGQSSDLMKFYLSVINFHKARALYQLKDYDQTISLINQTLQSSSNAGVPLQPDAIYAHNIIAGAYEQQGDFKMALFHKNRYSVLHDSLMQRDKLDMVNQLEMRYRIAEKDKAIAQAKLYAVEAENKNRTKNLWLVSFGLGFLLLGVLFASWLHNSRNKQRLQQEKIISMQQSIEIEKLSATLQGEEKERTRIARELHDGIGGLLTAAKLNFETAMLHHTPIRSSTYMNQGIDLLKMSAAELRNTAHHLMPEILLQGGLVEAVKYYCQSLGQNGKTEFVLQVLGTPIKMPAEFELTVYRMLQELMQNILKHAGAKHAIVQISFHENDLAITVEDDGVGFAGKESTRRDGMGITSIEERIKHLSGQMHISSEPGEGTSINLEFEYPNPKRIAI